MPLKVGQRRPARASTLSRCLGRLSILCFVRSNSGSKIFACLRRVTLSLASWVHYSGHCTCSQRARTFTWPLPARAISLNGHWPEASPALLHRPFFDTRSFPAEGTELGKKAKKAPVLTSQCTSPGNSAHCIPTVHLAVHWTPHLAPVGRRRRVSL